MGGSPRSSPTPGFHQTMPQVASYPPSDFGVPPDVGAQVIHFIPSLFYLTSVIYSLKSNKRKKIISIQIFTI